MLGILGAIVALGLVSRLRDVGRRSMSHVESFVPGLDVPEWTRPPPRRTVAEVLRTTVHHDGHPPAYFVGLLAWSKVFGTSLTAYRLPSVLLGALSIALVALVALYEGSWTAALLSAGLLALNGHHLFWSQMARMYAPAAALGLLSTWLLWRVLRGGRKVDHCGYLAASSLMVWTHVYCWPLLLAQILWSAARALRTRTQPVALRTQMAAVIVGLPAISLALYQNPPTRFSESALGYVEFGFAYASLPSFAPLPEPVLPRIWIGILGCALFATGVLLPSRPEKQEPSTHRRDAPHGAGSPLGLLALAVPVSVAMLVFAAWSPIGKPALFGLSAVPVAIVAAVPWVEASWPRIAARASGRLVRILERVQRPSTWLAILPVVCMLVVSSFRACFVARGTVIYLPYLVIAIGHGLAAIGRSCLLGPAVLALTLWIHAGSALRSYRAESDDRDYAGLAAAMDPLLASDDLVFVTAEYHDSPLFYHLRADHRQLVHERYAEALERRGAERAWVVWFTPPSSEPLEPMVEAVSSLELAEEIHVHGGHARLYRSAR